jgi:hypothetical protein
MSIDWKRETRHRASGGLVVAIAVFVVVATIVAAVRQDSWGPVWATGWLPAVLVASLARTDIRRCRQRLSGRVPH